MWEFPAFFFGVCMGVIEKVTPLVQQTCEQVGVELVEMKWEKRGERSFLVLTVDTLDETTIGFDQCTEVHRTLSTLLDVEDPIDGAYMLEVSSPGLDRPLIKESDYTRFKGKKIKLKLYAPLDKKKEWKGINQGLDGEGNIVLDVSGAVLNISRDKVAKACLIPDLPF